MESYQDFVDEAECCQLNLSSTDFDALQVQHDARRLEMRSNDTCMCKCIFAPDISSLALSPHTGIGSR